MSPSIRAGGVVRGGPRIGPGWGYGGPVGNGA